MKKIIKNLILGLCIVCLLGVNVQAEDVYTEFHVDNQTGKAGDVVTVPVEFNTGQEVGGFQITIYYDKEVMEFQDLEIGDLIEEAGGGIFDYNHIEESSKIIVVYVVPDTVKNEGSIVDLKFKLKKDCGERLPIGMKPDEIVDGTEQSNPIEGQVTGVDEEFQEKVVNNSNADPTDQTSADAAKSEEKKGEKSEKDKEDSKSDKDEVSDDKKTSSKDNKDKSNDEKDGKETKDQADKNENKKFGKGDFVVIAAFVGVMILSGIVVYLIKKKQNKA